MIKYYSLDMMGMSLRVEDVGTSKFSLFPSTKPLQSWRRKEIFHSPPANCRDFFRYCPLSSRGTDAGEVKSSARSLPPGLRFPVNDGVLRCSLLLAAPSWSRRVVRGECACSNVWMRTTALAALAFRADMVHSWLRKAC